jgi:hypothetical protein
MLSRNEMLREYAPQRRVDESVGLANNCPDCSLTQPQLVLKCQKLGYAAWGKVNDFKKCSDIVFESRLAARTMQNILASHQFLVMLRGHLFSPKFVWERSAR